MSLTSYRAAPPRVQRKTDGLEDLAATYSPTSWDAVPWALGVFTAEFGMGSGAGPPPKPPGHPAHPSSGRIQVLACPRAQNPGTVVCYGMPPGLTQWSEDDFHAWWSAGKPEDMDLELYRAIRTSQLHALPRFHTWPIDVMVYHGPQGDLVSRWVSRLDAFSGYPVRT